MYQTKTFLLLSQLGFCFFIIVMVSRLARVLLWISVSELPSTHTAPPRQTKLFHCFCLRAAVHTHCSTQADKTVSLFLSPSCRPHTLLHPGRQNCFIVSVSELPSTRTAPPRQTKLFHCFCLRAAVHTHCSTQADKTVSLFLSPSCRPHALLHPGRQNCFIVSVSELPSTRTAPPRQTKLFHCFCLRAAVHTHCSTQADKTVSLFLSPSCRPHALLHPGRQNCFIVSVSELPSTRTAPPRQTKLFHCFCLRAAVHTHCSTQADKTVSSFLSPSCRPHPLLHPGRQNCFIVSVSELPSTHTAPPRQTKLFHCFTFFPSSTSRSLFYGPTQSTSVFSSHTLSPCLLDTSCSTIHSWRLLHHPLLQPGHPLLQPGHPLLQPGHLHTATSG